MNAAVLAFVASRPDPQAELTDACGDSENGRLIACMIAGQIAGRGAMPLRLGLTRRQFTAMMRCYFPGIEPERFALGTSGELTRLAEQEELRALFIAHAADPGPERVWIAEVLAAGCMGEDHLWQDLGLSSRRDLGTLIAHNFPSLARRNDRDMKWKRFFYKQLCAQEGIHTCRSPSCEACHDYSACFGPES